MISLLQRVQRSSTRLRHKTLLHRPTQVPTLHRHRTWSTISTTDSALTIHALNASFPYTWLRDACPSCPECIHPTTSQKLHKTSDIQLDIAPARERIDIVDDGIRIEWTDGHTSFFTTSFLQRHASHTHLSSFHQDVPLQLWDRAKIARAPDLFLPYDSLRTSPRGLLTAIDHIRRYGLLFVTGVPNRETSDDGCELPVLAQLFGEVRSTFYGRLWDVVHLRDSRNIAYTNLDLGLHMDLLYFEHPPRYQILHCLRNKVRGGTSIFVDALHAASTFRNTHPSHFDLLTKTPVAFHYINDGHHLHYEHPTIELAPHMQRTSSDTLNHHHLHPNYVNYSPPFQAPLPLSTPQNFYSAFTQFTKTVNDPRNMYSYTLQEGDAVFFDNRRVLHARTAFFSDRQVSSGREGEANRWLKGCYLEADDLMDRGRVLRTRLESR